MQYRVSRKLNKLQRNAEQKAKVEYYQRGTGLYIFRNNTKGRLQLPKPTASGMTHVDPNEEWQGDGYYMKLVQTNDAKLVKCLQTPDEQKLMLDKEKLMNEQKLILDQPNTVTNNGVVEQIVVDKTTALNEQLPAINVPEEVLINEDPMDGVDIILE